jgi:hypothetical protein
MKENCCIFIVLFFLCKYKTLHDASETQGLVFSKMMLFLAIRHAIVKFIFPDKIKALVTPEWTRAFLLKMLLDF